MIRTCIGAGWNYHEFELFIGDARLAPARVAWSVASRRVTLRDAYDSAIATARLLNLASAADGHRARGLTMLSHRCLLLVCMVATLVAAAGAVPSRRFTRPSTEPVAELRGTTAPQAAVIYAPTWESLDSRPTPDWWVEQKFSLVSLCFAAQLYGPLRPVSLCGLNEQCLPPGSVYSSCTGGSMPCRLTAPLQPHRRLVMRSTFGTPPATIPLASTRICSVFTARTSSTKTLLPCSRALISTPRSGRACSRLRGHAD